MAASASTATTCAMSPWPASDARSASSCKMRSCSAGACATTSPTASPTPPRPRSRPRHAPPRRIHSSSTCPKGTRRSSASARALLVDPCLLILDDSTSAVDTETEAAIREALELLIRARRRTVFIIAQRISTVRDADLILVLDDGGVAAQGRHEDLLRESELYNQILGSQLH